MKKNHSEFHSFKAGNHAANEILDEVRMAIARKVDSCVQEISETMNELYDDIEIEAQQSIDKLHALVSSKGNDSLELHKEIDKRFNLFLDIAQKQMVEINTKHYYEQVDLEDKAKMNLSSLDTNKEGFNETVDDIFRNFCYDTEAAVTSFMDKLDMKSFMFKEQIKQIESKLEKEIEKNIIQYRMLPKKASEKSLDRAM